MRFPLDAPVELGRWHIGEREYGVLQVRTDTGMTAAAYALTRDGTMRAALDWMLTELPGTPVHDLGSGVIKCASRQGGNGSVQVSALVSACGLDLLAQAAEEPLWRLLDRDGTRREPAPVLAVAVCGYPVRKPPVTLAEQISTAIEAGFRVVKIPGVGEIDEIDKRLREIRAVSDEVDIIVDLEGAHTSVDAVTERARRWAGHRLYWIEDPFPPSHAGLLGELVQQTCVRVMIGDEWSAEEIEGLVADARGAPFGLRLDYTTVGGLTVAAKLARRFRREVSWHVYPEHHRLLGHAGLGIPIVDVFLPVPRVDFADCMLASGAIQVHDDGTVGPPAPVGSGIVLDVDSIEAHAAWERRSRCG